MLMDPNRRALRRKTVGASDAPIILGVSPWSSPHELWMEKTGLDMSSETQRTRLGNYLQHGVAMEALNQIGGSIIAEEPFAVHADGWASATPDYIVRQDDSNAIIEVKTTHERTWDAVPEHYLLQVNWQCWVHGIDRAYVAALHGGLNVQVYEVFPALQSAWFVDAVARCKAWCDMYMRGDSEPAQTRQDNGEMRAAIRAESGKVVDLDADIVANMQRLAKLKRSASPVTDEIATLEKLIKDRLASAEVGVFNGKTLVTWKESVSNTFDSARFKTDHPDLAKLYTKQSVSRRFLIKEDAITSALQAEEAVH